MKVKKQILSVMVHVTKHKAGTHTADARHTADIHIHTQQTYDTQLVDFLQGRWVEVWRGWEVSLLT
jgi:hypothetical protein